MLKRLTLFLFFFFSFFVTNPIFAFAPFINYPNNPLPFNNNLPGWSEIGQYQPSVLYEDEIFKMWYASYSGSGFKIVYATSPDGINWDRQNLLDLLPGFDNHDPSILKTASGYTMFFVATTNVGSQNYKIYRIESSDGVNFDTNSLQLVLQP